MGENYDTEAHASQPMLHVDFNSASYHFAASVFGFICFVC